MPYQIFWTSAAKKSYEEVIEFLAQRWSQKEINQFILRTEEVLILMSNNPNIYPIVSPDIHRCILSKHNSLFFKINDDKITILACWDNRKDPGNLKI
jgi:plasmid stabilization system protein ParE